MHVYWLSDNIRVEYSTYASKMQIVEVDKYYLSMHVKELIIFNIPILVAIIQYNNK